MDEFIKKDKKGYYHIKCRVCNNEFKCKKEVFRRYPDLINLIDNYWVFCPHCTAKMRFWKKLDLKSEEYID